jgi:hypothetical protein
MIDIFQDTQKLASFLKGQEAMPKILSRFVTANEWEQKKILNQAEQLNKDPVVQEYQFPNKPTKKRKQLKYYDGKAIALETFLEGSEFKNRRVNLPMTKVVDAKKRFQFILQNFDETAFIVSCRIELPYRRKGLFKEMVAAIREVCFDDWGKKLVLGSARPTNDEPDYDWRDEQIFYRNDPKTGKDIRITRLHALWLRQKLLVHSNEVGDSDPNGFAILNPKYLAKFSVEELEDLDKRHPKKENDSFFSLITGGKEEAK